MRSTSLEARAQRHILQKPRQHRCSALNRSGQQHAVRLQATHLPRNQVRHDHDLSPNQSFRLIVFRDPSQNLPLLRSQIDFETQQLVRLRHAALLEPRQFQLRPAPEFLAANPE